MGYLRYALVAIGVIVLQMEPAHSQKQEPVYGFGASTCRQYLSDIQPRGEVGRGMYFSWAQGFISATNMMLGLAGHPTVTNLTAKFDREKQQRTIDDLCRSDPKQEFARAILELYDRVREAQGLQAMSR